MLRDEKLVGLHAALTPSWNETAWYADYVLPMGYSSERHDLMSQETHASQWIGFRQPVLRVFQEKQGKPVAHTYDTNPGEVWEEDEFWIDLSWAIDPDGSMGIRQWFESPYRHSVPGLPQAAEKESLTPLAYMRKYGAFQVRDEVYKLNEKPVADADLAESQVEPNGVVRKNGKPVGVIVDGQAVAGFNTPSRELEIFSGTMADWKWPECALPEYYRSHIDRAAQRVSIGGVAEDFNPEYMPSVDWPNDARGDVYNTAAHLPAAHVDPHAVGQCETAIRDRAQEPALGESGRRGEAGPHLHWRSAQGAYRDRLFRAARLGYRRPHSGRGGVFASSGPLAQEPRRSHRALYQRPGGPTRNRQGPMEDAADRRSGALPEPRSRWCACRGPARTIVTEISSRTRTWPTRSTGSGKPWRAPLRVPATCAGPCGCRAWRGPRSRLTISSVFDVFVARASACRCRLQPAVPRTAN